MQTNIIVRTDAEVPRRHHHRAPDAEEPRGARAGAGEGGALEGAKR